MVKNKKPFINKKKASTYQLIHRSQRDVAPDHNTTNDTDSSSRMILWPKEDNIHSTTLPSTDRAVLMGVTEMEEEEEINEGEPGPDSDMFNASNPDSTKISNLDTTTGSILSWKQQLQQMGVLDTVDHEEFLRPITGTGVFLDANHGGRPVSLSSTSNHRTPPVASNKESTVADSFVADDAILEVNRVMESLPLTTDCMDEEIAAILFAQNDGDDDQKNNILEEYEELNDDFIFMATGMIPIDEGDTDLTNNNSHTNVGVDQDTKSSSANFDFDAHIQQLINTAKLGRENNKVNKANHPDEDFFAKHWQKPLKHINEDHDGDDDDEDEFSNDEDYRNITKDRYLSYTNDDENSVMGGGSSVYTSTTLFSTTGAAKLLNPDEEKALCDKFAATLAEYDNDSNDEYDDYNDEYRFGKNSSVEEENRNDDNDDESKTIQSSSFQCATIGRPLVGDAVVEAALDEYLLEREDDIFIHGNTDRMRRTGGSGFAVLVGKQMINAKVLDNATTMQPSSTIPVEEMYPEQEPAIPIDEYIAIAQERLLQPKEKPPAEEIFIDGKSYYDERPRNPWDCESILSTYSNLDNNPITIGQSSTRSRRRKNMSKSKDDNSVVSSTSELDNHHPNFTPQHIRLSTKTGLPIGVFDHEHAPSHNDEGDGDGDNGDDTYMSVNKGVKRSKDETPEEKRVRKLMIKRERELARIQKKITKEIYNSEIQKHMPMISEDHMAGKTVFRFS